MQAPVTDPVDRRNAPFVQVLLILIGILVPLNKAYYLYAVLSRNGASVSPGLAVDLVTDVLIAAAAWSGVWLIRQGRFRQGVMLFLGVLLLCMAVAYASIGMGANNLTFDPIPLLILAIAGLVLGRRMLWTALAVLLSILALCLLLGIWAVQAEGAAAAMAGKLLSMAVIYLLITILLDRTVAALRNSLAESEAQRGELMLVNMRLQHEIAERDRAREQLIHAQKIEAVGRLASGVAHDFDNILSVVLGHAMRRERIADQGKQALVNALEDVELAARRGLSVNRKLLNLSRQEVSDPSVFDMMQVLSETLPMLKQLFNDDVRIELEEAPTPLPIFFDRERFELILLNIASNACDAMPEGGRFHLTAIKTKDERHAELMLTDTGSGMPASVRDRVFDPFFTTKPSGSGTGLGLSMVHDMVVDAGGSIRVDSEPGVGCTICITLPLA
ncbi:MAG TPA: ATP-binding protein [Pseudoxanthomonas sp.]